MYVGIYNILQDKSFTFFNNDRFKQLIQSVYIYTYTGTHRHTDTYINKHTDTHTHIHT